MIDRRLWASGAIVCAIGGVMLVATTGFAPGGPSRDGPVPGFSGGFGESNCQGCHFDGGLNEEPGRLVLDGLPESWQVGAVYPLTLTLTRPGMVVSGFQLTARFEHDADQAGTFAPTQQDGRTAVTVDQGVEYVHHLRPGSVPVAPDTARWLLTWTAPRSGAEDVVVVNVAANAGDGDGSQLGDRIYTLVATVRR